tara:strand:+ start:1470 stop:1616 length:147 start_codon:yes stop_codon:yes gene_type:complete
MAVEKGKHGLKIKGGEKPIKDIKITAKDIRLLAEKVLGIDVITENINF